MLILYLHPLASFCHKVLIALYENDTPFEGRVVNLADPEASAGLFERWPVGKIPVLEDTANGRVVAETSIIIEYLHQMYPGPSPLIPKDADAVLEVRLWDRFFDLYVSVPMQKIVLDRLRPEGKSDPFGVKEARETLRTAYDMAEHQLAGRQWAAGEAFSMADCAALPALFFAVTLEPYGRSHRNLASYFERLLERASVARTIDEAGPYFQYYPYRETLSERFYLPQG
ncbi:glutathione S-transferase family protein [Rhizobium sp. KVB221]|uniref:Glutathione S-transferase family protein n=1 Tax=Rhizobium setariae TaxID=2801340 RepID=A0A937CNZ5_9HYPH|nr:glutathione S-transferase family protein [Rhizobium setariae]MBL0371813.1 glutathione S-transferase family protein [Rhizobium setariae]